MVLFLPMIDVRRSLGILRAICVGGKPTAPGTTLAGHLEGQSLFLPLSAVQQRAAKESGEKFYGTT
jgi:hypothetical protein